MGGYEGVGCRWLPVLWCSCRFFLLLAGVIYLHSNASSARQPGAGQMRRIDVDPVWMLASWVSRRGATTGKMPGLFAGMVQVLRPRQRPAARPSVL